MKPFKLIAFTGKAKSGKTTAADYLVLTKDFYRLSFADAVRREAAEVYDLDLMRLFQDYAYKAEHRDKLIEHGNGRRAEDPFYWVKKLSDRFHQVKSSGLFKGAAIDDLGFINEGYWCWGTGGRVIRIERNEALDIPANTRDFELHNHVLTGAARYNGLVDNNADLPSFYSKLDLTLFGKNPPLLDHLLITLNKNSILEQNIADYKL